MRVVLAQPRGFCAGVERAIEIVERAIERFGPPVYVRHEIVHNRHVVEGLRAKGAVFVEELDAWKLKESMGMDLPPIMIYGDDVTHIVTEEGIANLLLCRTPEEREQAIRGVAGFTPAREP